MWNAPLVQKNFNGGADSPDPQLSGGAKSSITSHEIMLADVKT
jgi:hypothetical protein